MTSLATIFGIAPLALGLGDGAQSRISMGIAVVGGMIFATFLTLFVVPAIYTYISSETTIVTAVADQSEININTDGKKAFTD